MVDLSKLIHNRQSHVARPSLFSGGYRGVAISHDKLKKMRHYLFKKAKKMFIGGRTEDVHSVMVMTGDPSPYMLPLASLTVRSSELFVVISSMFLVFCTPWQINMSRAIVEDYPFFGNIQYITLSLDIFHLVFAVVQLFFFCYGDPVVGREYVHREDSMIQRTKNWAFWLDMISAIPLLSGTAWSPASSGQGWSTADSVLLFRIARLHWMFHLPASIFNLRFDSRIQGGIAMMSILYLMQYMAVVWLSIVGDSLDGHLYGRCLAVDPDRPMDDRWVDVECPPQDVNMHTLENPPGVWIRGMNPSPEASFGDGWSAYLMSLKFGVYMVIGLPIRTFSDNELIAVCVASPIGGVCFAILYAKTTVLIAQRTAMFTRHLEHVSNIQSNMHSLDIPKGLARRLLYYHHYLAFQANRGGCQQLISGLSVPLFLELRAYLFRRLFTLSSFFKDASAVFVKEVLLVLEEVVCAPGEVIIREGDIAEEMYFVLSGSCEVLDEYGFPVAVLGENSYFGEVSLVIDTPQMCTIRAETFCILGKITRSRFLPLLEVCPQDKQKLLAHVAEFQRQEREQKEAREAEEMDGLHIAERILAKGVTHNRFSVRHSRGSSTLQELGFFHSHTHFYNDVFNFTRSKIIFYERLLIKYYEIIFFR